MTLWNSVERLANLDPVTLAAMGHIKAVALSILQEHKRTQMTVAQVQARLDEKLEAKWHKIAWQLLITGMREV